MPKDLAALLVEDGAVSADAVERALARQRELGGALDTALLEEGAIAEEALVGYLARAAELPLAPDSAWSAADARARRVFPSRVAERHGLAPFALDGRELALVATYPVDVGLLDEISFMLSLHLTAHVGPEWRVRELIHRLYGSPLPARLAALAVAGGVAPPAPTVESPPAEPAPAPAGGGFGGDQSEPLEPLAAALAQALENVESFAFEDVASDSAEPGEGEGAPPEGEGPAEEELPPPDRTAPPRWGLDDARAALAAARHRDEVVVVALRYARDFFEYAAMFAVTRDAVAGHDALGAEEARDHARSVAIWSSDPGIFRTVIETQSPYLGPVAPGAAGTDAVLHGLARRPRTVLVYPVLLRDRAVCILYADNGEAPVSPRRLGDLLLFLSTVGPTFERIIRARKKRRRKTAAAPSAAAVPAEPAPPAPPEPAPSVPAAQPAPPPEPAPPALAAAGLSPPEVPAVEAVDLAPQDRAPPELADPDPAPALEPPSPPEVPAAPGAGPAAAPGSVADSLASLEDQFFGAVADPPAAPPEPPRAAPPEPPRAAPPEPPRAAPPEPPRAAPPPEPPRAERARPPEPAAAPPVAGPPDASTLAAVADRALDADPEVAAAACAALERRRRDPALRPVNEKLRRALLSGISTRALRAARAIGALRDVEAIPLLIQVLETSEPDTAQAAADALAAITLQRLGVDARRWLGWWKENRGRGRAEWLFSGLTNAERETRVAAAVELSTAAAPPVPYSADMPAAEREKAARAWAGWWARSGNVL